MSSSAYFCNNITRLEMRIRIYEGLIEVKKLQIRALQIFHSQDNDYIERLFNKNNELRALKAELKRLKELVTVLIAA